MTTPSEIIVPLWDGLAPQSSGTAETDVPALYIYLPKNSTGPAPALLVCPGGGYQGIAIGHEGHAIADWFIGKGVAAFVLRYRLPANGYRHPVPLQDIQRAVRLIRARATEWNIDPARLGVMGFSAGGHLSSTLITHFDAGNSLAEDPVDRQSCRPEFAVLVYPVITLQEKFTHEGSKLNLLGPDPDPALVKNLSSETQVTTQTPPTLLVHAADDDGVPIDHSRIMLAALQKAGVASDLHEYPVGGHGFGHGPNEYNNREPAGWLDKVYVWIKEQGFVP